MQRRTLARAAVLALAATGLFAFAAPASAAPAGSYQQSCRSIETAGTMLEAECRTRSGFWTSTQLGDYAKCAGDISNNDGVLVCNGSERGDRGNGPRTSSASSTTGGNSGSPQSQSTGHNQRDRGNDEVDNDRDRANDGDDTYRRSFPRGPYEQSCRNIHADGADLIAECRTWDGEWHRVKLRDYARCGHIVNDDGRLRCDREGGRRDGDDHGPNWQPKGSYQDSCRNIRVSHGDLTAECRSRRGWRYATLQDARSCRGDIANERGRLVCVAQRRGGITLYRDRRFGGDARDYTGDAAELGPFADRASSARVSGGSWQLCTRRNFGGRCVTVNDSVSDFFDIGMNDQVESIKRLR